MSCVGLQGYHYCGMGGGVYLIKGLREISIRMLALADCDAVTASGWESPILPILITINVKDVFVHLALT